MGVVADADVLLLSARRLQDFLRLVPAVTIRVEGPRGLDFPATSS